MISQHSCEITLKKISRYAINIRSAAVHMRLFQRRSLDMRIAYV